MKLTFHPLFWAFLIISAIFGQFLILLNYLIVMVIHEYGHAFMANRLGYGIRNLKLLPFGICLNLTSSKMENRDEIAIALAGPFINLLLFVLCMAVWWLFPATFMFLEMFAFANLITAFFNLLPILPLDGGRVLVAFFSCFFERKKVCKLTYLGNLIIGSFLIILFFIFIKNLLWTFLFMGVFVILAGLPDKNADRYDLLALNFTKKEFSHLKSRNIVVKKGESLLSLAKYVNKKNYLMLYVIDDSGKLIKIVTEQELLKMLEGQNIFKNKDNN